MVGWNSAGHTFFNKMLYTPWKLFWGVVWMERNLPLDRNLACPHWKMLCCFNSFLWGGGSVNKFLWPRQGPTWGSGKVRFYRSSIYYCSLGASYGTWSCFFQDLSPVLLKIHPTLEVYSEYMFDKYLNNWLVNLDDNHRRVTNIDFIVIWVLQKWRAGKSKGFF